MRERPRQRIPVDGGYSCPDYDEGGVVAVGEGFLVGFVVPVSLQTFRGSAGAACVLTSAVPSRCRIPARAHLFSRLARRHRVGKRVQKRRNARGLLRRTESGDNGPTGQMSSCRMPSVTAPSLSGLATL
ncbi:hypothetical protein GCM10018980_17220 [Streptomyces capoamus]|uniref:Uncharacterized protein n=1 Tax=Streptomyces capoamus TaxID=68183 RepID=A0A919C3A0_9ACTN|nr:hypothetical protein GCM10010501_30840 [Streptomyces libani subsp. rufus]GHG41972.1 hypothetical protein GCM10018980_17220 [Streptomyces capoamus]